MKKEHIVRGAILIFIFLLLMSIVLVVAATSYEEKPEVVTPTITIEENLFNSEIIYAP